ncbi:o-succinylbenzoate--CoA ligase [Dongshaea marina]|uniref:o-succinylbenzoate--CoA ligase n=1 Tax=Dongshaea marina TaxID=2047966 RepID=UPI000D3E920C|nr:o-succinylbenzoate--CoA ligase [Dongshaea marina]
MAEQLIPCPLAQWARSTPEDIALVEGQTELSFAALDKLVSSIEQQLIKSGLRAGQHLATIAPNSIELIALLWACLRQQIIFCPLNPKLTDSQHCCLLRKIDPHKLWARDKISRETPRLKLEFQAPASHRGTQPMLAPESLSNMVLTSGSSGEPKAVVHRLSNHLSSAQGSAKLIPLRSGDRWLLSLPLFHVGGLAIVIRCLLAGASICLEDKGLSLTEQLYRQPISHLSLVSTQLYRLLQDSDFNPAQSALRCMLLGGGAFSRALLEATLKRGIQPFVSYGLSEMSSQVCTRQIARITADVGSPLPGREIRIENQEILVRGQTLFAGYYQDGQLKPSVDKDGWFHTKDRGELTTDGKLQVLGRMDRQFISGGENIQPEAIECELLQHPQIINARVIPVEHPEWGQRPICFVQLHQVQLDEATLRQWLRERLASFLIPERFLPWPETAGLKVTLPQLQKLAAQSL